MRILRCLSSIHGVLSFSTHLLKRTTTMMPEIGYGSADILKDVGMVYNEIVWYIYLLSDSKVDVNKEVEQVLATENLAPNVVGIKVDTNTISVFRHVNPVSMKNGLVSHCSIEPEYFSVIQTRLHHHKK